MRKYLHFEGLRGVAAFIVFLAHFRPTFCRFIEQELLNKWGVMDLQLRGLYLNFMSLFYEGTLPVYIFWLMSAYVISIKLFDLKRNENNKYLVEASTKRYFRLAIPVFFSSLFCFILLKANMIYNIQLAEQLGKGYENDWLNYWYHFHPNILHFLKTSIVQVFIPGNSSYNMAFWTMNPELLGSFLCFGLFAVIGKNKSRFMLYLILISFLSIAGFLDPTYFYYVIFVCGIMWSDSINSEDEGVYLKETIRKIYSSRLTVIILFIVGFGGTIYSDAVNPIHENLYYFFTFPVKALAFTLLVNNFSSFKKLFSIKPLLFMGKISFSFYLLHLPIMFSLGIYLYMYAGIQSPNKLLIIFSILTAVNILLSYLFMKYIDKKAISLSDRIGKYFSGRQ